MWKPQPLAIQEMAQFDLGCVSSSRWSTREQVLLKTVMQGFEREPIGGGTKFEVGLFYLRGLPMSKHKTSQVPYK